MEGVYTVGAMFIRLFQTTCPQLEKYFLRVSELTDPAHGFDYIFPLTAVLNVCFGRDVLAVCLIAEWSTIILKWLFMEDRPYWWVKEETGRPLLMQTKLTCETGPGSPSGHCTAAAAVGFVIAQWLCKCVNQKTLMARILKKKLNRLFWSSYVLIQVNVTLSRLFNATHFPHQCFIGIGCGLLVAYFLCNDASSVSQWWRYSSRGRLLLAASGISAVSLMAYWLQRLLGIDPQWSVHLAFKWCSSPDYLHVNTTPLYSLVRDSGAAFGIALASPIVRRPGGEYNRGVAAILTVFVCSGVRMLAKTVPTGDYKVFYTCTFLSHLLEPYLLLVLVPYLTRLFKNKSD